MPPAGGEVRVVEGGGEGAPLIHGGVAGMWFGTSDPHGVGSADRAPRCARSAPFSVLAHLPASAEELLSRPFARANVPPDTDALAPLQRHALEPPVVDSLSQVVPHHSQRLVRAWYRQLRRCLRAARAGNASLARRLRPDDVFLDHESHSMPETAAWDWDLMPLTVGLVARVMPVSGRDGVMPEGSVKLDTWCADAAGFADQAIVSEVVHGVSDDSVCRRGTLLCAPHQGALVQFAVAEAKLRASVDAGYATAPHPLPCWPLRTCPYSVVDESVRAGKPKFRLTTDLSWPHPGMLEAAGAPVDSVNGAMNRSGWPANRMVTVGEFADAVGIMSGGGREGRRVRMWSLDCEAFYRMVGRQSSELWRNGVWGADGASLDHRCCFGDASAATKCSRISNYLVFQMRRELAEFDRLHLSRDEGWLEWQRARAGVGEGEDGLFWVAMFVDDSMAASADDLVFDAAGSPLLDASGAQRSRADCHFDIARGAIERYGWVSAPSKEQPPCVVIDVLGVVVDLRAWRMRLSPAKCTRYAEQVRQVEAMSSCTAAEY